MSVLLVGTFLRLSAMGCSNPEAFRSTGSLGSGAAGSVGGNAGSAGLSGAAGDGLAGSIGLAGQGGSGTAGDTAGMGGSGVAGASGITGQAGIGPDGGAADAAAGSGGIGVSGTGGAGRSGTAGMAGGAGGQGGAAGAAGAAGTTGAAGITGAAGTTGAAGAGGPKVDGCNHVNWVFTPEYICDTATIPMCSFCAQTPTQCGPQYAIDGDTTTRYTDGRPQAGGEYVTLAFGNSIKLSGVTLIANPPGDGAKAYKAEYSTDGTTFVAFAPAVAGTGGLASIPINFPAATIMKALKITQTGAVVAPAVSWWSINEITLNGCINQ